VFIITISLSTIGHLTGLLSDLDLGRIEGDRRPPASSSRSEGLLSLDEKWLCMLRRLSPAPGVLATEETAAAAEMAEAVVAGMAEAVIPDGW
jgi:hypothetical protein